jgi:hypothetical protein
MLFKNKREPHVDNMRFFLSLELSLPKTIKSSDINCNVLYINVLSRSQKQY